MNKRILCYQSIVKENINLISRNFLNHIYTRKLKERKQKVNYIYKIN